jgi:hypothetical protein
MPKQGLPSRRGFALIWPMRLAAHVQSAGILVAFLALPLLSGCADSLYYQTRYVPSSSEGAFSAGDRMFWTEESEVYELPANPPALASNEDDEHRQRVDCKPPGQQFKSNQVGSGGLTEIRGRSVVTNPQLAVMSNDLGLPRAPGPGKPTQMAGWHDEMPIGAREPAGILKVAGYEDRPKSTPGSGIDTIEPNKMVTIGDETGYCPPAR